MSAWVLSLLVASCALAVNASPTGRIVGGEDAPIGKYPFQVSIQYGGSHMCGGSIINKRYILTAAHCLVGLDRYINGLTVVVGTNNLDKGGVKYSVEKLTTHDFDPISASYDIGLIRLKEDIEFSEFVQPVVISEPLDLLSDYEGIAIGWGLLSNRGSLPSKLQHLNVNVIDHNTCQARWRTPITDHHICGFNGRNKGVCNGDSGGVLLVDGKQVGIVSFTSGEGCAKGSLPDVYTRVSTFKNWIDENSKL